MIVYAGNKVCEVSYALTLQKMEEVKKLFKTDIAVTERYALEFFIVGSSESIRIPAIFTKEEAESLLYKLYTDGKLDLTEYIEFNTQRGTM